MSRHAAHLMRRIQCMPDAAAMKSVLPDLGESLSTAAHELARDIESLDKIDRFLNKLERAKFALEHLRREISNR